MNGPDSTRRLRALLASEEPVVAPGVYDPLTARLAEMNGFNAVYVGGWTTGAHTCATEPLLTLTEQLYVAERIARNVNVPVIMDGHTGYGAATHAVRTVRECEAAGIAAIHIEDQLFPKRLGYHSGIKHVVPLDEAVLKLKAAINARTDSNFLVIARTDAWGAENGGLDETIRRLKAFANAGAEALLPMVFDPVQARKVRQAIPNLPMIWLAGLGGMDLKETSDSKAEGHGRVAELSISDIRALGYEIIVYPLAPIIAAAAAVNKQFRGIRDAGICDVQDLEEGRQAIQKAIRFDALEEIENATLQD